MSKMKKAASSGGHAAKTSSDAAPGPLGDKMQGFYFKHGAFRAEDVQRVLGNPADSVAASPIEDLAFGKHSK